MKPEAKPESKRLVLFATDYVGFKITEYLCRETDANVAVLCLSAEDRGGFNAAIADCFNARFPDRPVLTNPSDADLETLQNAEAHLGILAWWPHILKAPLLGVPARGWINCHPSYLPFNQGKDPNFWCLVDGSPAGATLHEVTTGVDQGPIIAQAKFDTDWTDTGESVYLRSRELMVELFRGNFGRIVRGDYTAQAQDLTAATSHTRKQLDPASEIHLDKTYTARELINILRARTFAPHPGAHFVENGEKYSLEIRIKKVSPAV